MVKLLLDLKGRKRGQATIPHILLKESPHPVEYRT
jgi:hypothetical protein